MFKLEFETGNDAFAGGATPEVTRILMGLAWLIKAGGPLESGHGPVRDINGNTVGRWEFTP